MNYDEALDYILKVTADLEGMFDGWKPLQTRADERAYELLGRIYEEAVLIDADPTKRSALADFLRENPDVKASSKWSPNSKSSAELLVTNLLGLKHARTRKHNWLAALGYAEECEIEPTAAAFKTWIASKEIGGIDGAVELARGGPTTHEEIQLEEVVAKLESQVKNPEMVEVTIPETAPGGVAVLVVRRVSPKQGKVLKTAIEKDEIERVMVDLGIVPRPGKGRTPIQVANLESSALHSLNRITKKAADRGKFSKKDPDSFLFAVNKLKSVPGLSAKYFESHPRLKTKVADKANGNFGIIEVQNPDFHELDPGRFIGGAREGALIPYAFNPGDDEANRLNLLAYLDRPKKPEKVKYEPNPMALVTDFAVGDSEDSSEEPEG